MRISKGIKVEVFSTKEVPSGTWYPAEIIHGNGHNYTVKYDDGDIGSQGEEIFDRAPRKAIRPCPPTMQLMQDWASGDVVEVFHWFCWKMETVLKVLGRDRLLVRLLGSSHELEVRKVDIRPRLCWQDDEWNVIGKGSSNHEERLDDPSKLRWDHSSRHMETTSSIHLKKSYFPVSNINSVQEIRITSSQCLKRKRKNCHSQNQKIRVVGKDRPKLEASKYYGQCGISFAAKLIDGNQLLPLAVDMATAFFSMTPPGSLLCSTGECCHARILWLQQDVLLCGRLNKHLHTHFSKTHLRFLRTYVNEAGTAIFFSVPNSVSYLNGSAGFPRQPIITDLYDTWSRYNCTSRVVIETPVILDTFDS